ncbi:hypothetical protein DFH09DRAFT_1277068 [Mycena vulgaris]|nr:hypothetical protein DFH09DRAFT_1277068 [Mycena vulgaris]
MNEKLLPLLFFLVAQLTCSLGLMIEGTIDDTDPGVKYEPYDPGVSLVRCNVHGCFTSSNLLQNINANYTQIFGGTMISITGKITIDFTGTTLGLYFTTLHNFTEAIQIDGNTVATIQQRATQPVVGNILYHNTSIPDGTHSAVIISEKGTVVDFDGLKCVYNPPVLPSSASRLQGTQPGLPSTHKPSEGVETQPGLETASYWIFLQIHVLVNTINNITHILSRTENRAQQDTKYNMFERDGDGGLHRDLLSNWAVSVRLWMPGSLAEWSDHGQVELGAARSEEALGVGPTILRNSVDDIDSTECDKQIARWNVTEGWTRQVCSVALLLRMPHGALDRVSIYEPLRAVQDFSDSDHPHSWPHCAIYTRTVCSPIPDVSDRSDQRNCGRRCIPNRCSLSRGNCPPPPRAPMEDARRGPALLGRRSPTSRAHRDNQPTPKLSNRRSTQTRVPVRRVGIHSPQAGRLRGPGSTVVP